MLSKSWFNNNFEKKYLLGKTWQNSKQLIRIYNRSARCCIVTGKAKNSRFRLLLLLCLFSYSDWTLWSLISPLNLPYQNKSKRKHPQQKRRAVNKLYLLLTIAIKWKFIFLRFHYNANEKNFVLIRLLEIFPRLQIKTTASILIV